MSGIALGIVLFAAILHAGWNYLTKKSHHKIVFVWCFLSVTLIFYFPLLLYFWPSTTITSKGFYCILASAFLHAFYFWTLSKAYEGGDLSLVYPIARGSMPLFVTFLAVILIHEQLSVIGISGISLVVFGIYIIHLRSFSRQAFLEPVLALRGGASLWALSTGGSNGIGSVVDKVGVGIVYPPVYIYLMFVGVWLLLTPFILYRWRVEIKKEWQLNTRGILVAGFLVTFTYMSILFAMRMSPVSYVVAVRNVSIIFSALFGIHWLSEKHASQKLVGAILITLGVVFIGLST
jgi:drug/metabolite transporter (DMT)-like permease